MRNISKFSIEEYMLFTQWISFRSNLAPMGHLVKSGDTFGCLKAGTILEGM